MRRATRKNGWAGKKGRRGAVSRRPYWLVGEGVGLTKPQRLQWQPTPKQEARWKDVLARSVGRPWRSLATHSRRRASLLPFSGWTRRGPARSPSTWLGSSIRTCCGERVAGLASVRRAMVRERRGEEGVVVVVVVDGWRGKGRGG